MTAPAIPPFSTSSIEMVCRALGEACTGGQIPNLIAHLKSGDGEPGGTKWKRLFNAVIAAQNRQQDGRPLIRLVTEVMAPVRFPDAQAFGDCRVVVNERLLLSGYHIREDGKVARTAPAKTLEEAQSRADDLRAELAKRGVHADVLRFCRAELTQGNYFHAVLEASKSVAEKLRQRTGLAGDGSSLVDEACSINAGPRLAFNALATDWERSEHNGLAMLLKGLFSTFRNPTAHAPRVAWATSREEALDMLTLSSMLHRRLDSATVRPPNAAGASP